MQTKVTSPDGKTGSILRGDDGEILKISGDITWVDMAADLKRVKPNSATGAVNTMDAEAHFILRSLESVGWQVAWPEVEAGDENDDESGDPGDIIVN
ncbi:hypothetical protein FR773_26015 (plasmid) [Leclercia adecarboxylata]|uniref:hypothetical protein n=1 Tax=Leclercia adecarboxylata TaxID=83655 RepID=UPI0012A8F38F|nr:hypothetical protein [Leclercia adecarboxylata]QFH68091.1 hypothetical protein FR773_26015 [Leclercia adecarboxylata]